MNLTARRTAVWLALLCAALVRSHAPAMAQQDVGGGCAASSARLVDPDPDLYCIELLPAAGLDDAAGTARLLPVSSPFGAAVTPAGTQLYNVDFTLRDLPDPASLGPYGTYVAWVTTPQLDPTVKLGEVANGRVRLGPVAFDQFLLLISAEPSGDVADRTGRLALRGTSASVRMQPHDLAFMLSGLLAKRGQDEAAHQHDAADGAPARRGAWTPPPMHPAVTMPPELMTLRPEVSPYLPADTDVPLARPRERLQLGEGDAVTLVAAPVGRVLFGRTVTMLGFNGQYPGPLIEVEEGSTILVRFHNRTDFPTAVHWHGVRLENRFDGVPHVTQEPVAPGGSFDYRVYFRDAGVYWYHPHHREDVLQDLGLYGNLLVRSPDRTFYGPANREEVLMLDDFLVSDAGTVGYGFEAVTHALMGRFGNVLLVNGEPRWETEARRGEVVRFFLTNVSSTRVFNLSFQGAARIKVVASDLGRYERETWVENIVIAPAERYVVDVRFDEPGDATLVNRVRAIDHIGARFFEEVTSLAVVHVTSEPAAPDHGASFARLRTHADIVADVDRYRTSFTRAPDHTLIVTLEPGTLPFPLRPLLSFESVYRHPVEWSGTMPEMDWIATGQDARWILRDAHTGRENMDITWRFRVGDVVKLRFVNDRNTLHAMQHPIHIHGQRFLVVSVNGVPNEHLVWKDTVLVPTGFVTDVLLELSNPGTWMLHCHVSEHIETGMRMVFEVEG